MQLNRIERNGKNFLQGPPGQKLLLNVSDVSLLVEACFNHSSKRLLLYPENLTEQFFDLSSQEAGSILQKLRTYNIRLAVLCPETQNFSARFKELMVEEKQNRYFNVFQNREEAQTWLLQE
ncbi:MAG TPA: DUF4180 domain-containing protein [Acidobacteriota bacterium]|nr:DUF4180 domain-containing protein [Acidobacteriota bacterium]